MSRVGKKVIEIPKDVKVSDHGLGGRGRGAEGQARDADPGRVSAFKLEDGKLTAERQS